MGNLGILPGGGNAGAEFSRSRSYIDKNGKVVPDRVDRMCKAGWCETADCLGNNRSFSKTGAKVCVCMGEAADGVRHAEVISRRTLGALLKESELYHQRNRQWRGGAN